VAAMLGGMLLYRSWINPSLGEAEKVSASIR
jgi:hypothetical protein